MEMNKTFHSKMRYQKPTKKSDYKYWNKKWNIGINIGNKQVSPAALVILTMLVL